MVCPRLSTLCRRVVQGQVPCYLNNNGLNRDVFGQYQTVQAIHSLCKDGFLVNSISRDHGSQDSPESLKNPQSLHWRCRLANKGFEGQSKEDKEERNWFIPVIDIMSFAFCNVLCGLFCVFLFFSGFLWFRLPIQSIKDKVNVFLNQPRDSIDKIKPGILIEL